MGVRALSVDGPTRPLGVIFTESGVSRIPTGATPIIIKLLTVVDSTDSAQLFGSDSGSESFDVGLISAGVLDSEALVDDEATDVTVEARFRVENGDGDVLAKSSVSDVAKVTVERETVDVTEYGEVGGSGSLVIETA